MHKIEMVFLSSCDPSAQRRFYCDVLGMKRFEDGTVGYGEQEARLSFPKATRGHKPTENDLYWKIALAVPNIELACQQLTERGVSVGTPRQFQEIGYLAHFTDPEGFTIELIEHWFQGRRQDESIDSELLDPDRLGGGAHFNLLTLRTANIEPVIEACAGWKMTPLSIQPVESHGFTLYFFAFTADVPPSADLYAVENREWLYQRKYTVLEVQHLHDATAITQPIHGDAGYAGTLFSGFPDNTRNDALWINTVD